MTLDAMKSALLDAVFVQGRAWTESVLDVSSAIPGDFVATADELAAYGRFAVQVSREFDAVSGDLLEAGGVLGAPVGYVQEAGAKLMFDRYSGSVPFTDWRLWLDRSLRGDLVGEFRSAWQGGKSALDAAGDMFEVVKSQPVIVGSGVEPPVLELPTAQALASDEVFSAPSSIGSFGPVGFEASSQEIFTLSDLRRRREAGFAEHKVVNDKPRLQFTGVGLWEVSFRIVLSRNWTDPEERIEQLSQVQASGEHHPLVVGGRNFGAFVLVSYSEDVKCFGPFGEVERAEIDLTLREHPEEVTSDVQVNRRRAPVPAPIRRKASVRKLTMSNLGGR